MTTQLEGRALDRAIAELMGWKFAQHPFVTGNYSTREALAGGSWRRIPAFTESLDALRDGPERVLREAGWILCVQDDGERADVTWSKGSSLSSAPPEVDVSAPAEPWARALAVHAGLEELAK